LRFPFVLGQVASVIPFVAPAAGSSDRRDQRDRSLPRWVSKHRDLGLGYRAALRSDNGSHSQPRSPGQLGIGYGPLDPLGEIGRQSQSKDFLTARLQPGQVIGQPDSGAVADQ